MKPDVIAGLVLFATAAIAAAANTSVNRVSILALVLAGLGAFLMYNAYQGNPSYLEPWLPSL